MVELLNAFAEYAGRKPSGKGTVTGSRVGGDPSGRIADHVADAEFQTTPKPEIFSMASVDVGGYGITWNDEVDLSSNELWEHGKPC